MSHHHLSAEQQTIEIIPLPLTQRQNQFPSTTFFFSNLHRRKRLNVELQHSRQHNKTALQFRKLVFDNIKWSPGNKKCFPFSWALEKSFLRDFLWEMIQVVRNRQWGGPCSQALGFFRPSTLFFHGSCPPGSSHFPGPSALPHTSQLHKQRGMQPSQHVSSCRAGRPAILLIQQQLNSLRDPILPHYVHQGTGLHQSSLQWAHSSGCTAGQRSAPHSALLWPWRPEAVCAHCAKVCIPTFRLCSAPVNISVVWKEKL